MKDPIRKITDNASMDKIPSLNKNSLSMIIESLPYGLLMLNRSNEIVFNNSQVEKMFGFSAAELVNHSIDFLVPEESGDGKRKDQTTFPIKLTMSHLASEGESFFLVSIIDLSEYRSDLELLNSRVANLQKSNEDLQNFAYACCHDLQEPLRVISNYTQLIAKRYPGRVLDESACEFMEFTVDATRRMQELINGVLNYSLVDSRDSKFRETDCSTVVSMAVANLAVAIEESGALIHCENLPKLKGDSSQLLQLFQNLISNAIKFRSSKPPQIHISSKENTSSWIFTIQDNGEGLNMKFADRIFIIFQRLHAQGLYPGSGIGLTLCKKIVERHGGNIWVESSPGEGSSFQFSLLK
jgi:signal transduction histidine kinase